MIRRLSLVALGALVAACHGIEHPQSPISPAPVSLTPTTLTIIQNPGELPEGGGEAVFRIGVMSQAGVGVGDVLVALSASSGTLAAPSARTDRAGYAAVQWSGTTTATVTASIGDLTAAATIPVNVPPVPLPPSVPPPPRPVPPPDPPQPPPPPALTLTVSASPRQVAMGAPTTLTASVANLNPGEAVTAYQWDWEGTASTMTVDETSITASRSHIYLNDGVRSARVRILTSSGRSTTAATTVIVYRP